MTESLYTVQIQLLLRGVHKEIYKKCTDKGIKEIRDYVVPKTKDL